MSRLVWLASLCFLLLLKASPVLAQASVDLSARTDAVKLPVGTTAQRPTAINGMIRYNSSTPAVEGYVNGSWLAFTTGSLSTIILGTSASVTNPQRNGDATTGLFSPAASTVAVATGGTERVRVDSSGNVGIGTTTPSEKFNVVDSYTGTSAYNSAEDDLSVQPTANITVQFTTQAAFAGYADIPASVTKNIQDVASTLGSSTNYAPGITVAIMNGVYGEAGSDKAGATISYLNGAEADAFSSVSATISQLNGSMGYAETDAGTVSEANGLIANTYQSGGTVSDMAGLRVSAGANGGTATNRYGVFIEAPYDTTTLPANEYGIYQEYGSAINYFAGSVGIGSTSPSNGAALDIAGGVNI